jgi:hypothetical protein
MDKNRYCFNLHNILTFVVEDRRQFLNRLLRIHNRYNAYQINWNQNTKPDIKITLGSFCPDISGCTNIDSNYYFKENYMYVVKEKSKLGGDFRFDAYGLESGKIILRIDSNITASPFIAGRIIDFFIGYSLMKKGYSLIHASGVSKGGSGIIFSARGGGGKTTIALFALRAYGYKYLGDNFSILRKGQVLGFLSDINFFGYNINADAWKKFSTYEKLQYQLSLAIYKLSLGYIKIFIPISPVRIFNNSVEHESNLKSFCSLITGDRLSINNISKAVAIERTAINQSLEFSIFSRYIDEYRCVFPDSYLSNFWSKYKEVLNNNLTDEITFRQITVPQKLQPDILQDLLGYFE